MVNTKNRKTIKNAKRNESSLGNGQKTRVFSPFSKYLLQNTSEEEINL